MIGQEQEVSIATKLAQLKKRKATLVAEKKITKKEAELPTTFMFWEKLDDGHYFNHATKTCIKDAPALFRGGILADDMVLQEGFLLATHCLDMRLSFLNLTLRKDNTNS